MNRRWDALRLLHYDLIVADPPWEFESWGRGGINKKGAGGQYETMTADEIAAVPVGNLASGDCLLLLWTTGWAMATGQAQLVARAWGFNPITELAWAKKTRNGKPRMGTGYRARSLHEPILLCTTGNPIHKPLRSLFDGEAREHSRKPEAFYEAVARYCPNLRKRLDLFSRQSRKGYDAWGDEAGKFDLQLTGPAESEHDRGTGATVSVLKPRETPRAPIQVAGSLGGTLDGPLFNGI